MLTGSSEITLESFDADKIQRLFFDVAPGWSGLRLGGGPPLALRGRISNSHSYFGTFPFINRTFVSLLVTNNLNELFDEAMKISRQGAVNVVIHDESLQPIADHSSCFQRTYRVIIGPEERDMDLINDKELAVASGNKIGGRPFLVGDPEERKPLLQFFDEEGFRHYLQLDVPGASDPFVDEAWPFPNGMFHLYLRDDLESRWFWEF